MDHLRECLLSGVVLDLDGKVWSANSSIQDNRVKAKTELFMGIAAFAQWCSVTVPRNKSVFALTLSKQRLQEVGGRKHDIASASLTWQES